MNNPLSWVDPTGTCVETNSNACVWGNTPLDELDENTWDLWLSSLRTWGSIGIGAILYVGSGQSVVELITGRDYITGEETSRLLAAGGILAGAVPGGKPALKGGVKFFTKRGARAAGTVGKEPNRIYSARELIRRAEAGDSFHNFPESFNESIFKGKRQMISDNYVLYTQRGSINGVDGTFEIGVRPSASGRTEVITHRFFRPDR